MNSVVPCDNAERGLGGAGHLALDFIIPFLLA